MKEVCKILAIIILVLGLIGSLWLSYKFGINFSLPKVYIRRDWFLTIIIFISGSFGSFVNFVVFYSLGEILEYLGIIQKNIESYESYATKEDYTNDTTLWTCEKCGKKNKLYVGTCSCGYNRR